VAVLMGGNGAERAVSLDSGEAVSHALIKLGYEISQVNDIHELKRLNKDKLDVVFNILHGADGEDGQLAAWLQKESYVSTCCNYLGAGLSWHKDKAKIIAKACGLLTPASQVINKAAQLKINDSQAWIVKPACEGSSVGLFKAENEQQLRAAVDQALLLSNEVLIETFVKGVECTVGIVGEQVLPVVSIVPDSELYDYQAKYHSQSTQYHCPAHLPAEWQKALQDDAMKVYRALGVDGWGRVDFIVDDLGNRWFLEVNTTPGMTTKSLLPKAAKVYGWGFEQLVQEILQTSGVNGV